MQDILQKYLETNKRLVVPQLGAFLVKERGKSVLFSELMKRDDGVLRGLLCEAGRSELEAANIIDRFVFEVREAIANGTEYRLAGFGTLKAGPNGTIAFIYRPTPEPPQPSNEGEASRRLQTTVSPQRPAVAEPRKSAADEPQNAPSQRAAAPEPQEPAAPKPPRTAVSRPVVQPFPQPQPARVPTEDAPRRSLINTERMAESVRTAFGSESKVAEPSVKPSTMPAKSYDNSYDETEEEDYIETTAGDRKFDRFVLVAILAAVVAVAAIAFGFWHEARERQAENELFQLEEPYDTPFE